MVDVSVEGSDGDIVRVIDVIKGQCSDSSYRRSYEDSNRNNDNYSSRQSSSSNYRDSNQRNDYSSNNYQSNSNTGYSDYTGSSTKDESEFVPIDWDALNRQAEEARRVRWAKCPKMIKNFYEQHREVVEMTEEQADEFREANMDIKVTHEFSKEKTNNPMPKPTTKFIHAFHNYPEILSEIKKVGFERPSPIQSQMWPILMNGDDCIGIAQTGTGKTLGKSF